MNRVIEAAVQTPPRIAHNRDQALVTRILVDAFDNDPMWGPWAFPDPQTRRSNREAVFRLIVEGALRYPWVWLSGDEMATTVWIPPGGRELSTLQEQEVDSVLRKSLGEAADPVLRAFETFATARPEEPHYYLTMFGSEPDRAGQGIGQRLLSANLAHLDDRGAAAYLETRDELVPFYERFGFRRCGRFDLEHGPTVNPMWRDPHPAPGPGAE
jgi:ribosomal protein S18 acetylase RimI-like enzyme